MSLQMNMTAATSATEPIGRGAPQEDPHVLFSRARESFLSEVSPEEQTTLLGALSDCASPEALLGHVEQLKSRFAHSRWARASSKLRAFAHELEPYFKVVDTVISSNPEWAAVAWGALRLVLQLASNFASFFDRLVDLLEELKGALPRFRDLLDILRSGESASQRLRFSIQAFYHDLLELFQAVARVFTKKTGRVKRTPVVIAQLMWQPFDHKFHAVLARIEHHKNVVSDEIHVLCLRRTVGIEQMLGSQLAHNEKFRQDVAKYQDLLSKAHKKQPCHSHTDIIKFIDPPEFIEEYEEARRLRHPGSCTWLQPMAEFKTWRRPGSAQTTLWIKGKPGCGKSILAGNIIDEILMLTEGPEESLTDVLYFFFNASKPRSHTADDACRALLAQAFQKSSTDEAVLKALDFAMSSRKQGQLRGSRDMIWDTLAFAINRRRNAWLVIDGVDECTFPHAVNEEEHNQALYGFVRNIHRLAEDSGSKLVILSRPSVWGLSTLSSNHCVPSIHITPELISLDLQRYCMTRLEALVSEGLLPLHLPQSLEDLAQTMLIGADGMFLWARLMFSYLRSPVLAPPHLARAVRLRHIQNLRYPESLDQMYCRILGLLCRSHSYQRKLARQVFNWILFPKEHHLGSLELHDVLTASYLAEGDGKALMADSTQDYLVSDFSSFQESIILSCASLVELHKTRTSSYYRFIHTTVAEFFLERYTSAAHDVRKALGDFGYELFFFCPAEVEMELAGACCAYLRSRVDPRPLSGDMLETASRSTVQNKYPFLRYASTYWSLHLQQACISHCTHSSLRANMTSMARSVQGLLGSRLSMMTWIESMYLLVSPNPIIGQNARNGHPGHVESLQACASSAAMATRDPSVMTPQDFEALSQDLVDLSHFLQLLDREWGVSLRMAPEQIWGDITAFLPNSRFLQTTSATHISSMAGDVPVSTLQSRRPLSTISESDSSKGRMVKLTVWPSRAFEDAWYRLHSISDIRSLLGACSGWTARYQSWDTTPEPPALQAEYGEELDAAEVWSQVQNFLHQAPEAAAARTQQRDSGLKLAFPSSISPYDLDVFVVLRTVYRLTGRDSPASHNSAFQSQVIPLQSKTGSRSAAPTPRGSPTAAAAAAAVEAPLVDKLAYSYGFEFSRSGPFLLYHDTATMKLLPKGTYRMAKTLAAFEAPLLLTSPSPMPMPARLLGALECTPAEYFGAWTLHPKLPILVLNRRDLDGNSSIALWSFSEGGEGSIETVIDSAGSGLLSSLGVSDCGTNLILQKSGLNYPSVRSIARSRLYKRQASRASGGHRSPAAAASRALVSQGLRLGTMTAYLDSHAGAVRSGQIQNILEPDGQRVYQELTVSTSGLTGVDIVQHRRGARETQPLVSLPATRSIGHLSVDMSSPDPSSPASSVKVVINKMPQTVYSMSDPADALFPAVITKDSRAIRKGRKRPLGSLEDWEGGAPSEETPRKQQRRSSSQEI